MAKSSRLLRKKKTQRNKKYRHKKRRITRKYKNMRGGVIRIPDENPTYEYFKFIPKKTLFGTGKDKELEILVNYTNNTDKYESFRILEKNEKDEKGKFVENLFHSALKYEIKCGSNDSGQYYKINSTTYDKPVISNSSFSSYMNDNYVWRFKRIITAEIIEEEDLIPREEEVRGSPGDDALAQKEGELNTIRKTYYSKNIQ